METLSAGMAEILRDSGVLWQVMVAMHPHCTAESVAGGRPNKRENSLHTAAYALGDMRNHLPQSPGHTPGTRLGGWV